MGKRESSCIQITFMVHLRPVRSRMRRGAICCFSGLILARTRKPSECRGLPPTYKPVYQEL
jgi:hypothetical protein